MYIKKYLKEIFLSVIIILILGLYVIFYYQGVQKVYNDTIIEEENTNENEVSIETTVQEDYYVEIKGAVNKPGVYHVLLTNIINDVVEMAGGFLDTAYTDNINLSKKVKDEMVIYIYTKKQYKNLDKQEVVYVYEPCTVINYDVSSCIKEGESVVTTSETTSTSMEEETKSSSVALSDSSNATTSKSNLININTATKEELITLSGIGDAKATKIIEYRTQNGNFKEIHDIVNVSGISETIYENIKDYITV